MSVTSAIIGPGRYGDSRQIPARTAQSGALCASILNGRFYEQTIRGNMYVFSTAAAGLVMTAPATTNQFCIWNIQDNKVLFIPVRVCWATVSGAAAIAGSLSFYVHTGMSSALGTGAPFSVFTNILPVSTYIGGQMAGIGAAAACRFSTTNTATAAFAAVWNGATGWSTLQGRPTDAQAPTTFSAEFPGTVLWPGSCLRINSSSAMAWTAVISLYGIEVQLPLWAV